MNLTNKQKQHLKSLAHPLKPTVIIGANGFTEGVLAEIESTLNYHELIKIKINTEERETKQLIANAIARETIAIPVQLVGNILVLYRQSSDKKILLPK